MYAFPEMIDMGLHPNQTWPTPAHKVVAQAIAIANPNVKTRDTMIEIVQMILTIPEDKIQSMTYPQLVEAGMPDVGMYACG